MATETSPVVTKLRRTRFKLIAVLSGSLAVLVLSEIGLRVFAALSREADSSANDNGSYSIPLIMEDIARIPDDANRIRILFLGDSFTRGVGVKPNQTFVSQAALLLEEWQPGRYVTINLGLSGIDTIGEWALYYRARDKARADIVVQVVSPRALDTTACRELASIQEAGEKRFWISRYSCLSDLVEEKIRTALLRPRFVDYLKGGATQEERLKSWRVYKREILATKRLAEESGAIYVIVRFPLVGLFDRYPLDDVHRQDAAFAAELKVPYLDLLEVFRGHDQGSLAVSKDDPHPSAIAHSIAAKAITDFLKQSVLPRLPGPSSRGAAKPRSPEDLAPAEIQHYREILEVAPDCLGARLWLERVQAGFWQANTPKK